ncbi:sperm-associated antigen 4 protein-like [Heliangelus exortis]|uniref:sperm-associated antigen 4 protein-like n=1 Tax=Heliangelus exortis TaxID=472823 RepID=UPI003A94AA0C
MARRKGPRAEQQRACRGSSGAKTNLSLTEEAAGPRSCQADKDGLQPSLPSGRWPRLASLWGHLLGTWTFTMQRVSLKKILLSIIILHLKTAMGGVIFRSPVAVWAMWAVGLREGLAYALGAAPEPLCKASAWHEEEIQKAELLVAEVVQLKAELKHVKEEVEQAVSWMHSELYKPSDWALQSSGATIDRKRTSKTYDCREGNWFWWVVPFCRSPNPPDTILQEDVSIGKCWPFQGQQGQVVIRLPARVHLTSITLQRNVDEASPSGMVISAPRDVSAYGLEENGGEEILLAKFTYDLAGTSIQTFPLKKAPFPTAFSLIKLAVMSNWGNPAYTCIYRVQVHGQMAKPEGHS